MIIYLYKLILNFISKCLFKDMILLGKNFLFERFYFLFRKKVLMSDLKIYNLI